MNTKNPNLVALAICISLSACTANPIRQGDIDNTVEEAIDRLCPIPEETSDNRLKRANVMLAAIAGYGYRSIQNYSNPSELKDDAARVVIRLLKARASVELAATMKDKATFPVYRADMVIDLADAALSTAYPAIRAGKKAIVASVPDRLAFAKAALISILRDDLYLAAYKDVCRDFSKIDSDDLKTRFKQRCDEISELGSLPPTSCN